ncbi:hypothetical protein OMR58_10635 [Erwinia sp. INIA-01]|uniref:TadE/TadG family type IV pilus assembly protein n=1 Tax=Erwinia sp. INIA01 TaxID=2991500 RepID=UPI0022244CF0|nr:hypothetical protein [Erwinia sp. INIA01]MCW1874907.1 hypothetical protein [Erwinia sp. INIA01]
MNNLLRRLWRQQHGSLAVETALALPIVLAAGAVLTDLITVELEREHMEQRAGAIASVLAMQSELSRQGLSGLLAASIPDENTGSYQLNIANVRQNGQVYWQLLRGNNTGICTDNVVPTGSTWPGELPEVNEESGKENVSMIVVELCRNGSDITMLGGLTVKNQLKVSAINRVTRNTLTLDATLAAEAGLEEGADE